MTTAAFIMTTLWLLCAFLWGILIIIDKYKAWLIKKAKRGEVIVLDGKCYVLSLVIDDKDTQAKTASKI